jgi:hypothetical protein
MNYYQRLQSLPFDSRMKAVNGSWGAGGMTTFARVQQILDTAVANWQQQHGRPPILAKHDISFGWGSRDQLVNSLAFGLPLIAQDKIDNKDGDNANIIIALRTGVPGFPRMPIGGPFLGDPEIQEIVDWINGGALADQQGEA